MKFGKNFEDLSIPEWKNYNLEYNELKSTIKTLNTEGLTNLKPLYKQFLDNFDVINLFIATKYEELNRKFGYHQSHYEVILKDTESDEIKLIKFDILSSNLIDLSLTLKNLSKFILIQKIAVKKIFKKFLKHYFDKEKAQNLITRLKLRLNKDERSFINFNLLELTTKLTNLINLVKQQNEDNSKGAINQESSSKIISKMNVSENLKFILTCHTKRNFNLKFLIPDDSNNFNEILLNFNIYMNFKSSSKSSRCSLIYLQNEDNLMGQPSFIFSEEGQTHSTIITHIEGIRKFSYCALPNNIIEVLLNYVNDADNSVLKGKLKDYFHSSPINSLIKLTIETILNCKLSPKIKVYFDSKNYYMVKDQDEQETKIDFLLDLRYNISTTTKSDHLYSLDFENQHDEDLDSFPHNVLTMYSSDPNLFELERNLVTEIDDNILKSKYSTSAINKLPKVVKKVIQNSNSINLFKNFDFYQYCLSCYFNVQPHDANNHYSNLLGLNLFKSFENTEIFNNELHLQQSLLKLHEDKKLKNQMSLTTLQDKSQKDKINEAVSHKNSKILFSEDKNFKKRPKFVKHDSIATLSSFNLSIFTDRLEDIDEIIENEDNESLKLFWKEDDYGYKTFDDSEDLKNPGNSTLNNFVNNLINLKYRMSSSVSDYQSVNSNSEDFDLMDYYYQFNKIISFFYLLLNFISLFISGIELGIIYSVLELNKDNKNRFVLWGNVWLFSILIIGLLISFITSILSINLIFKRVSTPPFWHYVFIFLGFALVMICSAFILILSFI